MATRIATAHDEANKRVSDACAERDSALKKIIDLELALSASKSSASTQKRTASDQVNELRKEMHANCFDLLP